MVPVLVHTAVHLAAHRANGGCWTTSCTKGWQCNHESGFCEEGDVGGVSQAQRNPQPNPRPSASGSSATITKQVQGAMPSTEASSLAVLDSLWRQVTQSHTVQQETLAIEQVKRVLEEGYAEVAIIVQYSDRPQLHLSRASEAVGAKSLRVVFSEEGKRRAYGWKPLNIDSALSLLRASL